MKISVLLEKDDDVNALKDRIRNTRYKRSEEQYDSLFNMLNTKVRNGDIKVVGKGGYAVVYDAPRAINSVIKKSSHTFPLSELDGYIIYLDTIAGNADQNPYLPQIDYIKFYEVDRGGKPEYDYVLKMEKLIPIKDIMNILNSTKSDAGYQQLVQVWERLTGEKYQGDHMNPMADIVKLVDNAVMGKQTHKIQEQEFLDAIDIIKKAKKRANKANRYGGIGFDINSNNLMFRRTPVGLQLVITDPIA